MTRLPQRYLKICLFRRARPTTLIRAKPTKKLITAREIKPRLARTLKPIGLTTLVIVGLSSFHVTQRTKQIGTRRALGAKRIDILRQFVLENWLITAMGAVLGVFLTVFVAYWLEVSFSLERLDWRYLPVGIVVLWLVSSLAVLEPARRAASVSPAVATRSV